MELTKVRYPALKSWSVKNVDIGQRKTRYYKKDNKTQQNTLHQRGQSDTLERSIALCGKKLEPL